MFEFSTNTISSEIVETKDGKRYFVKGTFANSELDIVNDILTKNCLVDMVEQIKSKTITVDVEHEAFRGKNKLETALNKTTIPIGKITDFVFSDEGIEVKTELNKHNSRFSEVWGSLKDGFLNAFSFAYIPKTWTYALKGKNKIRMLKKLDLLNITFTGNPVNPTATIKQVFAKSLDFAEMEVEEMSKEKKEVETVDYASDFKALKVEIDVLKKELESAKVEGIKGDEKVLEIKSKLDETNKELTELKAIMQKPQMKAVLGPIKVEEKAQEKPVSILSFIK